MADLGNLNFGVHLKDYTDAEADKIKKKLENLSISLKIDGSNVNVSRTDLIKKQVEDALKSVSVQSVKIDGSNVKTQVENAVRSSSPQISVTVLKQSLANDLQGFLNNQVFSIGVTVTRGSAQNAINAAFANISVPVNVTVSSSAVLQQIRQTLSNAKIKIGVEAKNPKDLINDISSKLKGKKLKVDIEADKQALINSVKQSLKGTQIKAHVDVSVDTQAITRAVQSAINKANFTYSPNGRRGNPNSAAQANRNLANSYRQAAGAANEFARASVNLSNGLHTNIRFGGQLGTMLGNFASILASQDILQNIFRIGGELENQRIALGAILQDGGKATEMFSKIQSLAVKSPFGVMDLNKYVKQLSAYSVPYNELYETMKRLADISAGVGVDMGRIILAFGQVKAAGFLKGTELRQFTEANIPMVDKLAERFTHLTGEIVTAGEVYDMISKKKVTFEDVKSVLWDLTDEGGMFNNMQEVLSESLASKWKNLADAIDVMLGKIADGGVGNGLKSLAEILTSLTKQWDKLGVAISAVSTVFFSRKFGSSIMAYNLASVKGSTRELQKELILLRNRAKVEMAATGNIFSKFVISTKRDFAMAGASLRAFGNNFSAMIKRIGVSLKALTLNFLPFAAMTALFEGIYYFINKSQESAERIKDISSAAFEGFDNLSNKIKSIGDDMPKTAAGIASSIEKMETAIKDYAPNSDFILGGINKADSKGDYVYGEAERYKMLNQALKDTQEAYRILATEMEGFSETANKATDGVFDHSFIRNVKDASDAMQSYKQALNDISSVGLKYESAINKAKEADAGFAKATEGKSIKQTFDLLKDYEVAYKTFYEEAAKIGMGGVHFDYAVKKLKEQQKVALDDAEIWIEKYKGLLQSEGWDLNNLSQARRIAISIDVTKLLNSIEGLDDETKKLITTRILEKEFKIKLTSEEEQAVNAKTKKDYDESKDEVAKLWKKRAEEIDKAVAAYDKWKKIESASKAEQRIKGMDEFANLFNGKYGFSLGLEDPTEAYRYIQSKLNKNLSAQNEVYIALGVKLSDSEFKDAEEKLKLFLDQVKNEVKETSEQWNLYKQLFELTGDKGFAMTAFNKTQVWDDAARNMKDQLEQAMGKLGLDFDADFDIGDSTAKEIYGELYDSWKQIKDRIEKNGIDLKLNTGKAIQSTQSIEEKIKSLENQRDEDLKNYTEGTKEYDRVAQDWENKIIALRGELFELSPAFKDLFVDTTGMASGKLHELWQKANALVTLINQNTTRFVTNANGETIGRYYKDEKGQEKYISEEQYKRLGEQTNKLAKKVPEVKVAFDNLWKAIKGEGKKGYEFKDIAQDIAVLSQEASNAAQSISSMFDSLGNESLADAFALGGNILNGVSQIGSGIASGNPFAVLSGVTGIIGSIAQAHDKKLDRAIQKSQLEVTRLSNAYSQLETIIERQLGGVTAKQSEEMLENLKKQRSELYKQYGLEDEKKKTDKAKLEDYKNQIAELDDQIKYFYEDLASEQYGADISGWAGQIADALTEAFASGEDAAKAFDDTVGGILKELATEAIRLQFIEPAMDQLKNYLFGNSGIFTDNSESGTALSKNEMAGLASELDKLKSQIAASNEYWDYINEATGGLLENTEKSESSMSKAIQGVSENTAELLSSYINDIRANVSVKRALIEKLIVEDIPQMSILAKEQLTQLNNIAANTLRNADAADRIYDLVNRVVDKSGNKLKI